MFYRIFRDMVQVSVYSLMFFFLAQYSWGRDLFCGGGLHAPGQSSLRSHDKFLHWGTGSRTVVTFSFIRTSFSENEAEPDKNPTIVTVSPILNSEGNGIAPFPNNARQLILNAFAGWNAIADIAFQEVQEVDGVVGDIRIGTHNFPEENILAHGFFPPSSGTGKGITGDLHFNKKLTSTELEFFVTAIHEIGHNLGLDHIVKKKDNPPQQVVMYAILESGAGPLTRYDQAYVQEIYGPPIPTVRNSLSDLNGIEWDYPFDPFQTSSFSPLIVDSTDASQPRSKAYTIDLIRCTGSDFSTCKEESDPKLADKDVLIKSVTEHELNTFRIYSAPINRVAKLDDAEQNSDRAFNVAFDDSIATGWHIATDRSPESDQAFVIDFASTPLSANYRLPLSSPILATDTTKWIFRRSYVLSADDSVEYRVSDALSGKTLFSFVENGVGTSSPTNVAYNDIPSGTLPENISFQDGIFIIDLSDFSGGEIALEYNFFAGSDDPFLVEAVYIDDIVLENISQAGSFSLLDQAPPEDNSLRITNLDNDHILHIQALYDNFSPIPPTFSLEIRKSFPDFLVEFTFTSANNSTILRIGQHDQSTNGNDDSFDLTFPVSPKPFFYLANQDTKKLQQDVRSPADTTRWRIVFDPADNEVGELTYSITKSDTSRLLFLQPLEHETPLGAPIKLTDLSTEKLSLLTARHFEVVYGVPQNVGEISLEKDWNLVSIPVISSQTVESLFKDIKTGPVWSWNGKKFAAVVSNQPLNPERAYWIYSTSGGMTPPIIGVPTDGIILLQKQWNLIGTIDSQTSIPVVVSSALEWDATNQMFKRPDGLRQREGYWLFSKKEETVNVGNLANPIKFSQFE